MLKKERSFQYDFMRVAALLCIIGVHVTDIIFINNPSYNIKWWLGTALETVERIGLPIYFMLSGYLILNGKEEPLIQFYRKRFTRVVIPLFVYSFIYLYVTSDKIGRQHFSLLHGIKQILNGPVYFHLWFVYTIIGLYLAAPFIKILVKNLSDNMLKVLFFLMLLFHAINIYLPLFRINIAINSFIFDSWILYFILGYALTKIKSEKVIKVIYLLGIVSFILSLLIKRYLSDSAQLNLYDLSPTMVFMASSFFLIFEQKKVFLNSREKLWKVFYFISKYSYSIYLIHTFVLDFLFHNRFTINDFPHNYIFGIPLTMIAVLIVSLIFSIFIDTLIVNPLIFLFNWGFNYCSNFFAGFYKQKVNINLNE